MAAGSSRGISLANAYRPTAYSRSRGYLALTFGLLREVCIPACVELDTVQIGDHLPQPSVAYGPDRLALQMVQSRSDVDSDFSTNLLRAQAEICILEIAALVDRVETSELLVEAC